MNKPTVTDPSSLTQEEAQQLISAKCREIEAMLLAKNRKYGNSALTPRGVFSKGLTVRQRIAVRLDDKIKRKENQQVDDDEDIELDITGYLILDLIARDLGI